MSSANQPSSYLRQLGETMVTRPPITNTNTNPTPAPEIGKPSRGLAIANEFTGHLCIAHAPVKKIYHVSYLMMVEPTLEHPLHKSFKVAKTADLDKLWPGSGSGSVTAKPVKVGELAFGFYREQVRDGEKERPLMVGVGRVVCVFDDCEVCLVRSKWEGMG
ncbi:hypothetical protein BJY00DRAFT_310747 [Aspergillus carlsbadensis]|nr:hypothetical protein BJY00DRAFT_310747 [Aspergillus carlsbadensis]